MTPEVLHLVGIVGAALLAGFAALVQDRHQTCSRLLYQRAIGYMFLALGVQAWMRRRPLDDSRVL
ncbi:hypothetical protein MJ585_19765 [Klebsiella pneumoniae]|nr:hypothetical protein MJ585_19765 [Klebsiella pneumoniae]